MTYPIMNNANARKCVDVIIVRFILGYTISKHSVQMYFVFNMPLLDITGAIKKVF